ncbi:MAG: DUF4065 domain-containing protein [Lachnospiraceae bacterium]|nr:DUF4065 domain-containing protein [Lachnospiraceae bacterium]
MTKCRALEAANYLVYLMSGTVEDLTNMKLNKILYYAQGQCLLQTGEPLFDDAIEAWGHGPVIDAVYHRYKKYNDGTITDYDQELAQRMPEEDAELLLHVAREYGRYTASALRSKTHLPNSPWSKVYVDGQHHTVIPVDLIREYFIEHEKEVGDIQLSISDEDFVGRRDADGILVLPKDWDDEEV